MKNVIKAITLLLVFVMMVSVLGACGEQKSETVTNVKITITAGDTVILKDVDVAVAADEPTVMLAFQQAMDDDDEFPDVKFNEDDEGNLIDVLDIGEFVDTAENYWEFRLNDKKFAETKGRAATTKIKEGDQIFFEYDAAAKALIDNAE